MIVNPNKKKTCRIVLASAAAAMMLLSSLAFSQTSPFVAGKMDTVLYGVAYYTEYMPYERLDKDVQLMQQAGINVVRLGESSWGLWEPEEGKFEYAWMDRVVERMHKAHIKVILGTPTYSVPAWMYKEHPEIFVKRLDGKTITYGMRQNADLANPTYRKYCERNRWKFEVSDFSTSDRGGFKGQLPGQRE